MGPGGGRRKTKGDADGKSEGSKNWEHFKPTQVGVLRPLETRRQGFVPLEGDVIEGRGQGVPAGAGGRFRSHDVRLGHHPDGTPAKRPVHEANLDFYRSSRLNPLRAKEKDATRTDICRAEGVVFALALPSDALQTERQAEFSARVGAPLLDGAHSVRWNARNALRLGPRRPRRRVHDGGRRVRG